MKAISRIIERARTSPRRIVLSGGPAGIRKYLKLRVFANPGRPSSEAEDQCILQAAQRATREGIARIVLVDPATSALAPSFSQELFALRSKKGMTLDEAKREVLEPLCFANLMVRLGHADGSVAGAVHTTADVVRTAIQIIGILLALMGAASYFQTNAGFGLGMIVNDGGQRHGPCAGGWHCRTGEPGVRGAMERLRKKNHKRSTAPQTPVLEFPAGGSAWGRPWTLLRHCVVAPMIAAPAGGGAAQRFLARD